MVEFQQIISEAKLQQHYSGVMKLGQNTSRDKKYVRTFKAVEAGVYYIQAIEAGECTYLI